MAANTMCHAETEMAGEDSHMNSIHHATRRGFTPLTLNHMKVGYIAPTRS